MGRFLLGVICALAVGLGIRAWGGQSDDGGDGPTAGGGPVADGGFVDEVDATVLATRAGDDRDVGRGVPVDASGPVGAGGPAAATFGTFGSSALQQVRDAKTVQQLLDLLEPAAGLLRSADGREAVRESAQRFRGLDAAAAGPAASRLFELCARESIAKSEVEARAVVDDVRQLVHAVARRGVFDPGRLEGAKAYRIQSGDTLNGIAAHFAQELGVPLEGGTLAVVNRISNPQAIQVGQRIKIPMQPIRTVVFKSSFLVAVYVGDVIGRTYWCAHGRVDEDTPLGTFQISKKIEEPDWDRPGGRVPWGHPDNPLGVLFIGLSHESYARYGIHGTWEPESIGTRASAGCVRLTNDDVLDFGRLVPRHTEVEIRS